MFGVRKIYFLGLLGIAAAAAPARAGFDAAACQERFATLLQQKLPGLRDLTPAQQKLVREMLLPNLGRRLLESAPNKMRPCVTEAHCLRFPAESGKGLRVEWLATVKEPQIISGDTDRTLRLPENFDSASLPDGGTELVQNWTLGNTLHPYIYSKLAQQERRALGEPSLLLKRAQRDAITVVNRVIDAGERRFLFVAPTGVGKTEVLLATLQKQLQNTERKLHVIVADQNFLVDQLAEDIQGLQKTTPFKIVQWGGANEAGSFAELAAEAEKSPVPIVLVSTIQSVAAKAAEPGAYEKLRSVLGTLAFDEVHHAGALRARDLISETIDHPGSRAFFYGTTATPLHRDVGIQEDTFKGNVFWAYLDTPETYLRQKGKPRAINDVAKQLTLAIRAGELTPIQEFHFIDPEEIAGAGSIFHKVSVGKGDSTAVRWRLDKRYDHKLAEALKEHFLRHESGLITAGSVDEANRLTPVFRAAMAHEKPPRSFAILHSNVPREERKRILAEAKAGKINFLVTVRQLDEGVNVPRMDLFVDLNRSAGARQLLQRIGRVLRLYPGKEGAHVVTLMDITDEKTLGDKLFLLDQVEAGELAARALSAGKSGVLNRALHQRNLEKIRALRAKLLETSRARGILGERLEDWFRTHALPPSSGGATKEERNLYAAFIAAKKKDPDLLDKMPRRVQSFLWDGYDQGGSVLARAETFLRRFGVPADGQSQKEATLRKVMVAGFGYDPSLAGKLTDEAARKLSLDAEFAPFVKNHPAVLEAAAQKKSVSPLPLPAAGENTGPSPAENLEGLMAATPEPEPEMAVTPEEKSLLAHLEKLLAGANDAVDPSKTDPARPERFVVGFGSGAPRAESEVESLPAAGAARGAARKKAPATGQPQSVWEPSTPLQKAVREIFVQMALPETAIMMNLNRALLTQEKRLTELSPELIAQLRSDPIFKITKSSFMRELRKGKPSPEKVRFWRRLGENIVYDRKRREYRPSATDLSGLDSFVAEHGRIYDPEQPAELERYYALTDAVQAQESLLLEVKSSTAEKIYGAESLRAIREDGTKDPRAAGFWGSLSRVAERAGREKDSGAALLAFVKKNGRLPRGTNAAEGKAFRQLREGLLVGSDAILDLDPKMRAKIMELGFVKDLIASTAREIRAYQYVGGKSTEGSLKLDPASDLARRGLLLRRLLESERPGGIPAEGEALLRSLKLSPN